MRGTINEYGKDTETTVIQYSGLNWFRRKIESNQKHAGNDLIPKNKVKNIKANETFAMAA